MKIIENRKYLLPDGAVIWEICRATTLDGKLSGGMFGLQIRLNKDEDRSYGATKLRYARRKCIIYAASLSS